jgi:hypothetical protein
MDIQEFFAFKDTHVVPVFVLRKDLNTEAHLWLFGSSPYTDARPVHVPAGTELLINPYSNFGDGYSMKPVNYKKVFKGLSKQMWRWIRVNYKDMEYSHHIVIGSMNIKGIK